jgi:hypothetical protein
VIKDVENKFPHRGFESFIDYGVFADKRSQDGVIFFLLPRAFPGGFSLLHETDGLALYYLPAFEGLFRNDKAIHIIAIPAGRMQDESVGVWVFTRDRGRFQILQGFFVKDILAVRMPFVFDENFYGKHRCSISEDSHELAVLDGFARNHHSGGPRIGSGASSGFHVFLAILKNWIPAFTGMTEKRKFKPYTRSSI